MLEAWEARLNPNQTLEERRKMYPNLELETERFNICKKLIEAAQALMNPIASRKELLKLRHRDHNQNLC